MLQLEIIGNLGNDAEIKEFSGKKYVSMSVAHAEIGKDGQGNRTEQTLWVSVLWYGDGGGLFQYLKKGTKVFIRGRQRVKLYADRSGNAQFAINVNASEVQLCGSSAQTTQPASPIMQQHPQQQQSAQIPPMNNEELPF